MNEDRIAALLEVIEQLHGWIVEFDPDPCPIAMYLGGNAEEVTRWVDALGPLAHVAPEGYDPGEFDD